MVPRREVIEVEGEMTFPHYASGEVIKGFDRGSRELGIPTANYPFEIVQDLPEAYNQGVYYGWAQVDNGPVYKMVMSIGTNPYYNNEKKTMVILTDLNCFSFFSSNFFDINTKRKLI